MVMIDVWNFCWLQMFMLACLKNLLQSFYTVKAGICISVLQYFINLCFAWSFKTLFSKRNREKARGKKEEKEKIYSTLERGCEWINLRDRRSEKRGRKLGWETAREGEGALLARSESASLSPFLANACHADYEWISFALLCPNRPWSLC